MSSRRLLGERVVVRVAGCPPRDGVLISGVKKETKMIQKFHVRFPNGDVRTYRGDQLLLRGTLAPIFEYVRVGDVIYTKSALAVVRFIGHHEEFVDTVIVIEPVDPKLPTDPNVESFRKLFPSANLSDERPYNILTKTDDILKVLPPDSMLQQISKLKDKYLVLVEERRKKDKYISDELYGADWKIAQLERMQTQWAASSAKRMEGCHGSQITPAGESLVSVKFVPGRLGITADWSTGLVESISSNEQAENLGVQVGWKIRRVDDKPYTEEALDRKNRGNQQYTLTFEIPFNIEAGTSTKEEPEADLPVLEVPSFNEIQELLDRGGNSVEAGFSYIEKAAHEEKIAELNAEIENFHKSVEELQSRNMELEEKHKQFSKLRAKIEHLRNSRVMFLNQIKQSKSEMFEWKRKSEEFEKKYKLLEERRRLGFRSAVSSLGKGAHSSTQRQNMVEQKLGNSVSMAESFRRSKVRMPKPDAENTVSLLNLQPPAGKT